MQPADAFSGSPEWNAIPPHSKNTDHGIGAGCPLGIMNSLLLWSLSFEMTLNVPGGVSAPSPPEEIGTGPRMTWPFCISHAWWASRSTQARALEPHGGPAGATGAAGPSAKAEPANAAPAKQDMPRTAEVTKATRRFAALRSLLIRTFSQPERATPPHDFDRAYRK